MDHGLSFDHFLGPVTGNAQETNTPVFVENSIIVFGCLDFLNIFPTIETQFVVAASNLELMHTAQTCGPLYFFLFSGVRMSALGMGQWRSASIYFFQVGSRGGWPFLMFGVGQIRYTKYIQILYPSLLLVDRWIDRTTA